MGLPKDLKFHGQDFSNVASAYAFAYLAMQFPNCKEFNSLNLYRQFRRFKEFRCLRVQCLDLLKQTESIL